VKNIIYSMSYEKFGGRPGLPGGNSGPPNPAKNARFRALESFR
jgi:hypothetical protein